LLPPKKREIVGSAQVRNYLMPSEENSV